MHALAALCKNNNIPTAINFFYLLRRRYVFLLPAPGAEFPPVLAAPREKPVAPAGGAVGLAVAPCWMGATPKAPGLLPKAPVADPAPKAPDAGAAPKVIAPPRPAPWPPPNAGADVVGAGPAAEPPV